VVQARPSQNPCALHLHICILQYYVWQQCGASLIFTESLCSASCVFAFYNTAFCNSVVQAQPSQNPCALCPAHMHFTILSLAKTRCKPSLHRILALCILRMHVLQHCVWQQCGASPAFTDSLRSASCAYAFTILRLATTRCKPSLHRFFALCVLCICILQHCVSQQCGASPVFTESLRPASCAYAFYNTAFRNSVVQARSSHNPCTLHPAHMHFTILRFATVWCKPCLHRVLRSASCMRASYNPAQSCNSMMQARSCCSRAQSCISVMQAQSCYSRAAK
jgi:hypothetical protein